MNEKKSVIFSLNRYGMLLHTKNLLNLSPPHPQKQEKKLSSQTKLDFPALVKVGCGQYCGLPVCHSVEVAE